MIHLITGGSGSGKSAYAEQAAMECGGGRRFYVATMKPSGAEGKRRIARHRKQRQGKGFETVECFSHLERLKLPGGVILLECLSNLLANEQFDEGGTDEEILIRVEGGILCLKKQVEHIIIVTNEVFSDGGGYDADTLRFIRLLGKLNVRFAQLADFVTEVVCGIPVQVK